MYPTSMKNRLDISFNKDSILNAKQSEYRRMRVMNSKQYIVDLKPILRHISQYMDCFYFYPASYHGFVEDCIISSQREHEDMDTSIRMMYRDIQDSYQSFQYKAEQSLFQSQGAMATFNGKSIEEYEINEAAKIGEIIFRHIYTQMKSIQLIHGHIAILQDDLVWTNLDSIVVKVYF